MMIYWKVVDKYIVKTYGKRIAEDYIGQYGFIEYFKV